MKVKVFYLLMLLVSINNVPKVKLTPIVGGQIVKSGDRNVPMFPYMASLQEVLTGECSHTNHPANCTQHLNLVQHFCGGSLLNNRWILTAAHCTWWKDLKNIFAIIGYENLMLADTEDRYAVQRAEYIYFDHTNIRNDIAVLRLQKPYIKPINMASAICMENTYGELPKYSMNIHRNRPCKIIGYGATRYAGNLQSNLIEGEVFIISKEKCRRILGNILAPQEGENTVCALGNNQDTCQGDSGGPLICSYKGANYIYGIVSHGLTCGIKGMPSIYTLTIKYVEWIEMVIID